MRPYSEHIPRNALGALGVPVLGWLVMRALSLNLRRSQLLVLETDAAGFTREEAARLMGGVSATALEQRSSQLNHRLRATHAKHAVRIALEADLIDVPLEVPPVKNPHQLLSGEQYRALELTSLGYSESQTGYLMGDRSANAVGQLLGRAYDNLGVETGCQAVVVAHELGIFRPLTSEQLQPYAYYSNNV